MSESHKQLLVVAAHPDDELLGVGGTVARYVRNGWEASALILGTGALSRVDGSPDDVRRLRESAARAGEIIGFRRVLFESFPDNAFDTVSLLSITQVVEAHLARLQPSLILTHDAHDLNIDHQRTFQAVLTASRPCSAHAPSELRSFETVSASEWQAPSLRFSPDTYVALSREDMERKLQALAAYNTELRPFPHPRSLEVITALAMVRGSEALCERAEAFVTVRRIVK